MFTQDSRKLKYAGATVAVVGLIALGMTTGLVSLGRWAELEMDAYPYRAQDWLRYHLPTTFADREGTRIMLTGPSAVRENLIYDRFDELMPGTRARQGAMSTAKLEDVLLSLHFVEQVYGADALPDILLMGINPRFVANIPANRTPFIDSINKYSPKLRVESDENGRHLSEKSTWEGLLARRNFLGKQQQRYKAGLFSIGRLIFPEDTTYYYFGKDYPDLNALKSAIALNFKKMPQAVDFVQRIGLRPAIGRWLRIYTSPYKYHYKKPVPHEVLFEWVRENDTYWHDAYHWNPLEEEARVRRQFAELLSFTEQHGIKLYVINIPEHETSHEQYRHYEAFLPLVQDCLGDTPFLDLRHYLPPEELFDMVHGTFAGAQRLTDRVIEFVQDNPQ